MASISTTLGLLIASQLLAGAPAPVTGPASFSFQTIASPVTAGDSFPVTIIARDSSGQPYPYNGSALLSTLRGPYVNPNIVQFQNGVCMRSLIVTLAETTRLRCFTDSASGLSNQFAVQPGRPARLVTILPGEQLAPGTTERRIGRAYPRTAGDTFPLQVYLTDRWANPVTRSGDTIQLTSTDRFAVLPLPETLSSGHRSLAVSLRTAGLRRIISRCLNDSSVHADTSSSIDVVAGPFEKLLLVVPGETLLPGDNAAAVWETPGKSGRPLPQYLLQSFPVTVYATDRCWNPVPASGANVMLGSDFNFRSDPLAAPLFDSVGFSVQFQTTGSSQSIWAYDASARASYRTFVEVRSLAATFTISKPDTIRAGETAYIRIQLRDANAQPVKQALVRCAVTTGSGQFEEPALLTDTVGIATARFFCTAAMFAEHDSIRIWSGNADTTIGIYIDLPDSAIRRGEVIAFPNPFGFNRDACEICYYLPQSSPMRVSIHDPFGNEVITWRFRQGETGAQLGLNRIYWDGRNRQGHRVANGIYVLTVVGEIHTGTTFNQTYRIGVLW